MIPRKFLLRTIDVPSLKNDLDAEQNWKEDHLLYADDTALIEKFNAKSEHKRLLDGNERHQL